VMNDLRYHPGADHVVADPYTTYARMRRDAPVFYNEDDDFYAVSRFADVADGVGDWRAFTSRTPPDSPLAELIANTYLVTSDPPEHTRLRQAISQGFSPRRLADFEPTVRGIIRAHLDEVADAGACDFVKLFADVVPTEVISALLGVPPEFRAELKQAADEIVQRPLDSIDATSAVIDAAASMAVVFEPLVEHRREHPSDDLLSLLANAQLRGGEPRPMRFDELMGLCVLLYVGGSETTTTLLANSVLALGRYSDLAAHVAAQKSIAPSIIDEIVRWEPPLQYVERTASLPVRIADTPIPAGAKVLFLVGSACHDDDIYAAPEDFELGRTVHPNLGFGGGVHVCVGASLARLEARVLLEEWPSTFASHEIDTGTRWKRVGVMRNLQQLLVEVVPRRQSDDRARQ
jgi:cytochrome P450